MATDTAPYRRWMVITPEYGEVVPVTDEGQGPMEYGCDVIEVEATSRRAAIVIGVREMLRPWYGKGPHHKWCRAQRTDKLSPYAGVRAVLVEPADRGPRLASWSDHLLCPDCDHGIRGGAPCETCDGSGYVTVQQRVEMAAPVLSR